MFLSITLCPVLLVLPDIFILKENKAEIDDGKSWEQVSITDSTFTTQVICKQHCRKTIKAHVTLASAKHSDNFLMQHIYSNIALHAETT